MNSKRSLYNIGLNGNGYLLTNIARKRPRIMSQSSVFGTRFAQGDRSYLDFNLWWYWAQSEWSNGFKDKVSWADDGKYYFSSNIDAFSKVGSLQLSKNIALKLTETTGYNITTGASLNSPIYHSGDFYSIFLGTAGYGGTPNVPPKFQGYNGSSWVDWVVTGLTANSYIEQVNQIIPRNNTLWILSSSYQASGSSFGMITTWNTAGTTDHTTYLATCLPDGFSQTTTGLVYGTNIYIAGNNIEKGYLAIVQTSIDYPFSGEGYSDFTKTLQLNQGLYLNTYIADIKDYSGLIYFLISYGMSAELFVFDPTASPAVPASVWKFTGCNMSNTNLGGKLLFNQSGKLIITLPDNEIWSWDGTNMNRIWVRDIFKQTLYTYSTPNSEAVAYLAQGGVRKGTNIYWGNLMFGGIDSSSGLPMFFNDRKDLADDKDQWFYPLFADTNGLMWGVDTSNALKLYQETTTYKGASGKNFLVFSQNDVISTIDKIFHHATFNFNYLASGESIIIEYLLSDLTPTSNASWNSLGSASYVVDGATINTKTIYFPDNTVGKKMWLRVKLESTTGTTTPTFNDIAIAYLPMPDLKHDWTLYLECYDNMMLLDGKTKETKRGEELKSLLKFNWWSKTAMDFQDIDYAETLLNGAITDPTSTTITVDSTLDFPQQGRIRIEQEEILYTSKNATSFIGCTRGARGSLATTHADNTLVATNYKVIIQSLEEFTPELQNIKVKNEESVVVLSLREL